MTDATIETERIMTAHISPPISPVVADMTRRAEIAAAAAAAAADDVDRQARFPAEAFAACAPSD